MLHFEPRTDQRAPERLVKDAVAQDVNPFASCQFVDTTPGNASRRTERLHTPDAMACHLHFEQALPVISELE